MKIKKRKFFPNGIDYVTQQHIVDTTPNKFFLHVDIAET